MSLLLYTKQFLLIKKLIRIKFKKKLNLCKLLVMMHQMKKIKIKNQFSTNLIKKCLYQL